MCFSVWLVLARGLDSVDEDVVGTAGSPDVALHAGLPHHAGAEAGREGPLELVPGLHARVGVRRHAGPDAGGADGGPLPDG